MHELSIAQSLIDMTNESLSQHENPQVRSIRIRIGALSCVHPDALQFSFRMIVEGTPLQATELEIESIPVSIYCSVCETIETLVDVQPLICPKCQTPSSDIRTGKELDLDSIEIDSP